MKRLLACLFKPFIAPGCGVTPDNNEPTKVYFPKITEPVLLLENGGGAVVSDQISIDGADIGYMYREQGVNDIDNGWRFFEGTESQAYLDDINNTKVFDINILANHNPEILEYLDAPYGSKFERIEGTRRFRSVE